MAAAPPTPLSPERHGFSPKTVPSGRQRDGATVFRATATPRRAAARRGDSDAEAAARCCVVARSPCRDRAPCLPAPPSAQVVWSPL